MAITYEDLTTIEDRNARAISEHDGPIDAIAADLILRNIAVATDRLSPPQFSSMSTFTQDKIYDAANLAKKLAPLDAEDLVRLPHESNVTHGYRIAVYGPLHSLQAAFNHGKYDRLASGSDAPDLRRATLLASHAFRMLLRDAATYPEISQTIPYFHNNSLAAEKRLKPLQDR